MPFLSSLLLAIALTLAPPAPRPPAPAVVAIVGADVLPMTGAERLRDQIVIVSGDRIVAIGPRADTPMPVGATRIDAAGLMLMPGLVDMHVHLPPEPGLAGDATQRALAVMLAHGVTTVRSMRGAPGNLLARERVARGEIAGPQIYAAAPRLDDDSAPTAEAARNAVRAAGQAGYDLIKSHELSNVAIWEAEQDEARRQRLPVAGHVTNIVGLDRALAAGQEVEHLDGALFALLPADAPERRIDFAQIPPAPVIVAAARTSDAELAALAGRVAAARGVQGPTLALFERLLTPDQSTDTLQHAPEMRFVPRSLAAQWAEIRNQFREGLAPEQARAFAMLRRRIVRAYAQAGVPLLAGSDAGQPFNVGGPSLIREIEALAASGLGPMAALRSATVVPRDYLRALPSGGSAHGRRADFGTIEPGARADLILLRGDPSRDLGALRNLQAVIAGGRPYDRAALDALLESAAASAAAAD